MKAVLSDLYPAALGLAAIGGAPPAWVDGYRWGFIEGASIGMFGDGRECAGRWAYWGRGYRSFVGPYNIFLSRYGQDAARREGQPGFTAGYRAGVLTAWPGRKLSPPPLPTERAAAQAVYAQRFFKYGVLSVIRRAVGGRAFGYRGGEETLRNEVVSSAAYRFRSEVSHLFRYDRGWDNVSHIGGENERAILETIRDDFADYLGPYWPGGRRPNPSV